MTFSLADYILGDKDPRKMRSAIDETETRAQVDSETASGDEPTPDKAAPPEDELVVTEDRSATRARNKTRAQYAAEISRLLCEVSREWEELETAIGELRSELSPTSFSAALAAAGIEAVEDVLGSADASELTQPGIQNVERDGGEEKEEEEDATTQDQGPVAAPTHEDNPSEKVVETKASTPQPSRPPEECEVQPPSSTMSRLKKIRLRRPHFKRPSSRGPRAEAPPSGSSEEAPAQRPEEAPVAVQASEAGETAIHQRLEEVITLLKQNLGSAEGASRPVEVPAQLTQEIARQVAGRLKDSVLTNMKAIGDGKRRTRDRKRDKNADVEEEKRIPIGDIAGIIDQLTGNP